MKKWLGLSTVLLSLKALAYQSPHFMRSPKALLMGDAFTAVNDDDFSLFYNPASLGRHKRDLTMYPFNFQFSGTNVLQDTDRFEDFPDEPVGVADVLMNYPAHASLGLAPGLKLFNVGVSFILNESFDALLRNPAHPMLDLDIHSDRGVVAGVGIPIGPGRISKKSQSGSQTSVGLSGKYIERTGLVGTYALSGPTVLDSLGKDEISDVLKGLGQVKGIGWGFDAGIEHVIKEGNSQYVVGLSAMDITSTSFTVPETAGDLKVAKIHDSVNLGLAMGQEYSLFHYVLSADIRSLNEQMEFGRRVRVGAQVGIPGLTVMAGMNSGYYSYGAMLNLGFMKFTAGFYDIEMGTTYRQIKSDRLIIYLSLFDFSFDA